MVLVRDTSPVWGHVEYTRASSGGSGLSGCSALPDLFLYNIFLQSGQTVDLDVAKNPSNVASVKALCLTDSSGNMHTHVKCDALSGGPCSIYSLTTEENTCKVFGMIHGPVARSKSHFDNVFRFNLIVIVW